MITNDEELAVTQQRITQFQSWLAQIRQRARPEEFEGMASGSRLEIERMQAEVMEYLLGPLPVQPENQPARVVVL